jgi:hypothetical protein
LGRQIRLAQNRRPSRRDAAIGEQSQVVGRFKQEKYNEDKDLEAKVCVLEHFLVQKQPKAEHVLKAF